MFERFNDRARKVMALANQEAQRLGSGHVHTAHVLLGIIRDGAGVACGALHELGLEEAQIRGKVEALLAARPDPAADGALPATEHDRQLVDNALAEARVRGDSDIATEHMLLGMMRTEDCLGRQALVELGVSPEQVSAEIDRLLAPHPAAGSGDAAGSLTRTGQHRNIEVKARCDDLDAARDRLLEAGAGLLAAGRQIDTYFHVPRGRLKLREGDFETALIHYVRADESQPRQSDVTIFRTDSPAALKASLVAALGVRCTVDKNRSVFVHHNVKLHLDEVENLGSFLEIEAVDVNGEHDTDHLLHQCRKFMHTLSVRRQDLVGQSYSDMLSGAGA